MAETKADEEKKTAARFFEPSRGDLFQAKWLRV
jgi:hypothetical protein